MKYRPPTPDAGRAGSITHPLLTRFNPSRFLLLALFLGGALLHVPSAAAQSFLLPAAPGTDIALEWARPRFDQSYDFRNYSFFTSAAFLTARVAVSPRFVLVGSLPLAHVAYDDDLRVGGGPEASTDVGNPYVGFQYYTADEAARFGAGVHLPLADNESLDAYIGALADYDRFESFVQDYATVSAEAAYRYRSDAGLRLEGALRPAYLIYSGDSEFDEFFDNEFFLHYEGRGWYGAGAIDVGAGLSGIVLLSESDLDLSERTLHHASLYVVGNLGNVRPGVFLRLPLDDDIRDVVDVVFGLGVAVTLP